MADEYFQWVPPRLADDEGVIAECVPHWTRSHGELREPDLTTLVVGPVYPENGLRLVTWRVR